ncbi:unnamed protein product [Victoria cruziana]
MAGAASSSFIATAPSLLKARRYDSPTTTFRFSPRSAANGASGRRRRPSVSDVELAIGAGKFRDRDFRPNKETPGFIDIVQSSPVGQEESGVERRLREVGEWMVQKTEGEGRSGQEVLMLVGLKILPIWLFALLVASGIIKLPFSIPFLDDYLM